MAKTAETQISYWGAPGLRTVKPIDYEQLFLQHPDECFGIIKEIVCKYKNVGLKVFHSKDRHRPVCMARHLFCYIVYHNFRFKHVSLSFIGKQIYNDSNFGTYDHTTVIHAKNLIKDLLDSGDLNPSVITSLELSINQKLKTLWLSYL